MHTQEPPLPRLTHTKATKSVPQRKLCQPIILFLCGCILMFIAYVDGEVAIIMNDLTLVDRILIGLCGVGGIVLVVKSIQFFRQWKLGRAIAIQTK